MKISKFNLYIASAIALSFGVLTSCSDKDNYEPGENVSGAQVYFPSTVQTQYTLTSSNNTFTVTVARVNDSETVTVPVTVTPQPGNTNTDAFTFPGSVSFNAGEKTANFIVTYNIAEVSYDAVQQFELKIDDTATTPYGAQSIVITAEYPSPWTLLGTGTYTDNYDWVSEEEGATTKVRYYRNDLDPDLFRVNNPYKWDTEAEPEEYFQFRLLHPGDTYLGQTIPSDFDVTIVGYSDFVVEYNTSYNADMWLLFPGRLSSMTDPSTWVYNYVVDWQDNGLPGEIHLSPMYYMFGVGGYNQTTTEPITMVFPGYNPVDASVAVTYNGMLHKPDESLEVIAYIELGADVTEAKVAVVPGSAPSADDVADIQSGAIESMSVTTSGEVKVPFDSSNPDGKYSVVVVSYYGEEARSYDYATFSYTAGTPETWTLVGEGLYTYLEFWETNLGLEPEVLELYESDTTPGKFKITHWMNDQDFKFTVNDAGVIYVLEEQNTGVTSGGAEIWVDDFTLWGTGAQGELEDGVYYFAVIYYNSVSGSYYAYGYESFEPVTAGTKASYSTRGGKVAPQKGKSVKLISKAKNSSSITKNKGLFIDSIR